MGDELELLNEGGVVVTTRRFVAGGTTYQIRQITSVRAKYERPSKAPTGLLIGLALPAVVLSFRVEAGGHICMLFAVALTVFGLLMATRRATGQLFVRTSALEQRALRGSEELVRKVEDALNDAIARHE